MNNVNTNVTVSHRIGEGPWRSSQAPRSITFCVVLKKQYNSGNQIDWGQFNLYFPTETSLPHEFFC